MIRRVTIMLAARAAIALAVAVAGISGPAASAGGEFRVKASALAPAGADGTVRRVVQGFGTWTLICDENLTRRERVCNVSQEIVDADGQTAFSWSLAATRGGAPVMILRKPAGGRPSARVELALAGGASTAVELATCDAATCIGFLPVTKPVGQALRRGGTAQVTFMRDGRLATLDLPLTHLTAALAAMRLR